MSAAGPGKTRIPGYKPIAEYLESSWALAADSFHEFYNILEHFVRAPCGLVDASDYAEWLALYHPGPSVVDYELAMGRHAERHAYNAEWLGRCIRTRRPQLGRHMGFCELFVPVVQGGTCKAVLVCGPLLTAPPALAALRANWRILGGAAAGPRAREFTGYLRTALETPLMDAAALALLREFMAIYADIFAGRGDLSRGLGRVFDMRPGFSERLPSKAWNWSSRILQSPGPLGGVSLAPWDCEELGITRMPDTVVALVPWDGGGGRNLDEAGALYRAHLCQVEAFRFSREAGQTVAGRLEGQGALLLTSPDPSMRNPAAARLTFEDLARAAAGRLSKAAGCPVIVGLARGKPGAGGLVQSLREARAALHACVQGGQALAFYDDPAGRLPAGSAASLAALARDLQAAYAAGDEAVSAQMRERYAREVYTECGDNPRAMRAHFLGPLAGLLEALRRRQALDEPGLRGMGESVLSGLWEARSTYDILAHFEASLATLGAAFRSPRRAERALGLERSMDWVEKNLHRPLNLRAAAAQAGYSPSHFSVLFRRQAGMPFSAFLLEKRLEHARRLLMGGRLPLAQVAGEAGFNSYVYFSQAFKKAYGRSPRAYRG